MALGNSLVALLAKGVSVQVFGAQGGPSGSGAERDCPCLWGGPLFWATSTGQWEPRGVPLAVGRAHRLGILLPGKATTSELPAPVSCFCLGFSVSPERLRGVSVGCLVSSCGGGPWAAAGLGASAPACPFQTEWEAKVARGTGALRDSAHTREGQGPSEASLQGGTLLLGAEP